MTLVLSRDANLFDVASIHALLESYARQGTLLSRTVSELCENIRDFVVAESDGQFAGCGALHLYGQHLAEIRSIAVLPASQGQGIGRCLIEALLKEARRHGVGCVCLFTRVPEFFGKLGFEVAQRAELPDKIYKDCVSCPKLMDCDEIAMVIGKIPHNTNGHPDGCRGRSLSARVICRGNMQSSVSPELLAILVCPACRKPVELTSDAQGLRCAACKLVYPIRDGFPVMIKEEAIPESK